jgi:hypothetical protein
MLHNIDYAIKFVAVVGRMSATLAPGISCQLWPMSRFLLSVVSLITYNSSWYQEPESWWFITPKRTDSSSKSSRCSYTSTSTGEPHHQHQAKEPKASASAIIGGCFCGEHDSTEFRAHRHHVTGQQSLAPASGSCPSRQVAQLP